MKRLKIFLLLALLAPSTVFAAPANPFQELDKTGTKVYGSADAPQGDIFGIIATILKTALSVVGVLLVVLIVYAGFLWMTAAGKTEQVDKAKKMLTNTIIGLILVVGAYALTTFILGALV